VPRVGFEPTIPGFYRAKTVHALDRAATAIVKLSVKRRGQRFETREAIQKAVRQCLRMAGIKFYRRGILKLPERLEKCVQRSGDYVEV
jgi:hypothetical protein